jgi:copper chaperone NosL
MDMIPDSNQTRPAPRWSLRKVLCFGFSKHFVPPGLFLIGLTVIVLANCQKPKIQPVALEPNDMCSFCRMSISERRYAAELLDTDGQALKFDDLGCMANFLKQKKNTAEIRATFVMDFEHPQWVKAENAFYVRSAEFQTPMSGGIVAFANKSSAADAVTKYHGTLLGLDEVLK